MKKFVIVAYSECEERYLPRQEKIIHAKDHAEAERIAWKTFPEYHEIGAYEIRDETLDR